jgi:hypothetical protein
MASVPSSTSHTTYSDKQVVTDDSGKVVVTPTQPYPDAYAYANPNNTNNDSSRGGANGGGLEPIDQIPPNNWAKPAWSEQKPKGRICGLSRKNFLVVIAVVTALVAAAIIGGSVGGVLASKHNSGDSSAVSRIWSRLDSVRITDTSLPGQ